MKNTLPPTLLLLLFIVALMFPGFAHADDQAAKKKQTVLITGANRGLGLEMARQFVEGGYEVIGTARKPEKAGELKATGATVLQLDVTDQQSIDAMVKALEGKKIDILINNAGYFGPKLMTEDMATIDNLSREEMTRCFEVNALGPLFVTKALLPNLRQSPVKKVVNISTRAGMLNAPPYGVAYGYRVSKTALNQVTRTLSADKGLKGFIIVSIAPGHNKTDMGTHRGNLDPKESMKKVKHLIEHLTPKHHGRFWFYNGKELPW